MCSRKVSDLLNLHLIHTLLPRQWFDAMTVEEPSILAEVTSLISKYALSDSSERGFLTFYELGTFENFC